MKTIKNQNTGELKRVTDANANDTVSPKQSSWSYAPKSEWKDATRTKKVEKKAE